MRELTTAKRPLILVGRVLGAEGFNDSRLYAAEHRHVLRPRRRGGNAG